MSYVIPKSPLILFLSISPAYTHITTSTFSLNLCNNFIFAFSSKPGKTLAACLSNISFPPNSK